LPARYILLAVGAVFLVMGIFRAASTGWRHPQPRTWLMVAAIFLLVGLYLTHSQT